MVKMMQCVMPERCAECGVLFDLSYDFDSENAEFKVGLGEEEHLCWKCRDR